MNRKLECKRRSGSSCSGTDQNNEFSCPWMRDRSPAMWDQMNRWSMQNPGMNPDMWNMGMNPGMNSDMWNPGMNPGAGTNMGNVSMWNSANNQGMWNPGGQNMWMPMMDEDQAEMRDMEYWKQMYPAQTRRIQREVERQCDLMDYDGSVMYDEYPDRIALARICEAIYQAMMQEMDNNRMNEFPSGMPDSRSMSRNPGNMLNETSAPDTQMTEENQTEDDSEETFASDSGSASDLETMQYGRGNRGDRDRRENECRDGRNCRNRDRGLQNLIEVLLFNEMHRRRHRRRHNRTWYMG